MQKKIISAFLLCLLLAINWHNTFRHTHFESVQEDTDVLFVRGHNHQHAHTQSDGHHHHPKEQSSIIHWLQGLLGDFEHADFEDHHFELFLNSNNYFSLKHLAELPSAPTIFLLPFRHYADPVDLEKKNTPIEILSFSDPPLLASFLVRGPPVFS